MYISSFHNAASEISGHIVDFLKLSLHLLRCSHLSRRIFFGMKHRYCPSNLLNDNGRACKSINQRVSLDLVA